MFWYVVLSSSLMTSNRMIVKCSPDTRFVFFSVSSHATGGSFVRPKKVSFGVDFLSAVKQRYEMELDQAVGTEVTISTKTVTMVGFESILEKQR